MPRDKGFEFLMLGVSHRRHSHNITSIWWMLRLLPTSFSLITKFVRWLAEDNFFVAYISNDLEMSSYVSFLHWSTEKALVRNAWTFMHMQPHTDELFSSSMSRFSFSILLVWFHFYSTFFKEFHNGLARIIKLLLNKAGPSEAIFFSPKRGNSLDKFLETINQNGLFFSVTENYDAEVWKRHEAFMDCKNSSWPSYERDHCYPVMVRITI